MQLKVKLISTIAAACLVFCLLAVGIWAVGFGEIKLNGLISFNADNVYVSILGQVRGTEIQIDDYVDQWDVDTAPEDIKDWDLSRLVFGREGDTLKDIEIKITISNLSTERKATITLEDATGSLDADAGIIVSVSAKTVVLETMGSAGDSAEFTITISPVDRDANKSVKGDDFSARLTLENGDTINH